MSPRMSFGHADTAIVAATVGTTLAPWGLSFIQSYAVDKKLTVDDLRYERIDVVLGALLTGVIGFFVVVACAATLHQENIPIDSAQDAARALAPLAGDLAGTSSPSASSVLLFWPLPSCLSPPRTRSATSPVPRLLWTARSARRDSSTSATSS